MMREREKERDREKQGETEGADVGNEKPAGIK